MQIIFGAVHRPCIVERLITQGVKQIMVSFADPLSAKGWELARLNGMEVWLDSGAFSAWKKGKMIDIEAYAAYIRTYTPEVYFNLDVVGDPKKTAANQRALEKMGLKPVPVFHMGEPFELLKNLASKYDLVGLGGHVGRKSKEWFNQCFSYGYPIKFHGLGVTRDIITKYPFHSVDSSWWQAPITTGGGESKINEQKRRIWRLKSLQYRGYAQYQERLF